MGRSGSAGVASFTVTVTAKEAVAAPLPLQEHSYLPLSNLDLVLPRTPLDVSVFFCYANDKTTSFGEKAKSLKKALAETLVSFYVFAGEVVENSAGEPEIHCNNRGVDFWEASADDVELCELNLYEPDSCVKGKLVPTKNHGVFCVQMRHLFREVNQAADRVAKLEFTSGGRSWNLDLELGVLIRKYALGWSYRRS